MADPRTPSRSLSEIGHLFLSSVRERHMDGAKPPRRLPPGSPRDLLKEKLESTADAQKTIEARPQDIAGDPSQSAANDDAVESRAAAPISHGAAGHHEHYISLDDALKLSDATPTVSAIIASHLNGKQLQHTQNYARRLAASGQRVGLIELGSTEISVTRFEPSAESKKAQTPEKTGDFSTRSLAMVSPRQIKDVLDEMNCDLDQWLMIFPGARGNEHRLLLGEVSAWVMLSSCDHDGLVSCYRSLKGAMDQRLNQPNPSQGQIRPELSLALINESDPAEMDKVYRKIVSVCKQFMQISVAKKFPGEATSTVSEYMMLRTAITDSAKFAQSPQWNAVMEFVRTTIAAGQATADDDAGNNAAGNHLISTEDSVQSSIQNAGETNSDQSNINHGSQAVSNTAPLMNELSELDVDGTNDGDNRVHERPTAATFTSRPSATPAVRGAANTSTTYRRNTPRPSEPKLSMPRPETAKPAEISATDDVAHVIELPDDSAASSAIVLAVLRNQSEQMVECPLTPPMCPDARLAVNRDQQLMIVAASRHGLSDLRSIARAYQWLVENQKIISMAMPQYSIDAAIKPALYLLVDHLDLNSELMRPLFETETVRVHAYRRLRWGAKSGLLLEAA